MSLEKDLLNITQEIIELQFKQFQIKEKIIKRGCKHPEDFIYYRNVIKENDYIEEKTCMICNKIISNETGSLYELDEK